MNELALGLLTGCAFGFLLQMGGVLRFDRQVGALLFQDMTIVKFMLSAILVGSVGLQLLADEKVLVFAHKAMNVGGVVLGGLLFGAGWALAGYCPGTAVGAVGEGRWPALFVIAGMLAGADPWRCIAVLWGAGVVAFVWFEFKGV